MLSKKWLGSDTLRAMSEKYNALIDLLKGSDEGYQTTFARKLTKILPGNGLQGGGTLEEDRTLSVKVADEGIISGASGIRLDLIQVLTSDSTTQAVSGRVAKTLNERIDAITSGGEVRKIRVAEVYSDMAYEGELPSGQVLIAVGKPLFRPKLFIDGTLIPKSWYVVDLVTGTITLSAPYSDAEELPTFKAKWNVLDEFEVAVKFSYPTLDALVASADMKSRVNIGDVIQILGEVEAFDGGDRKVKCEATEGLNGINIGTAETPKWLNEVLNSRPELLRALIDANKSDILLKRDKTDKNFGNDIEFETLDHIVRIAKGILEKDKQELYRYLPQEDVWYKIFDEGNCPISKSEIGWCKFANGLIIQWGNGVPGTIALPVSFSDAKYFAINTFDTHGSFGYLTGVSRSISSMKISLRSSSGEEMPTLKLMWVAIGY